jgi:threonylcarbamoyladenosine tRNA methylthiotransferase MtaB
VGDYGTKASVDLLALLQRLVTVDGLDRIRISSIEPNLLTDEIIAFVASEQKMCKHFHIPLQSGTDEILRKMRRRYTTNDYVDRVHRIREFIPHCGIGADVIVGFPGETDLLFEKTSSFLKELPVSYLHVFTYSERPNTPAVVFENPVEPKVRFKRNEILRALGLKKRRVFHESMVGTIGTVLFEGDVEDSTRFGFTSNYVRVGVPAESAVENDLVKAEIIGVEDGRCVGRVVHEQVAA